MPVRRAAENYDLYEMFAEIDFLISFNVYNSYLKIEKFKNRKHFPFFNIIQKIIYINL